MSESTIARPVDTPAYVWRTRPKGWDSFAQAMTEVQPGDVSPETLERIQYALDVEGNTPLYASYSQALLHDFAGEEFLATWLFQESWHTRFDGEAARRLTPHQGEMPSLDAFLSNRRAEMLTTHNVSVRRKKLGAFTTAFVAPEVTRTTVGSMGFTNEGTTAIFYRLMARDIAIPALSRRLRENAAEEVMHQDAYGEIIKDGYPQLKKPSRRVVRELLYRGLPVGGELHGMAKSDKIALYLRSDEQAFAEVRRLDDQMEELFDDPSMRVNEARIEAAYARSQGA